MRKNLLVAVYATLMGLVPILGQGQSPIYKLFGNAILKQSDDFALHSSGIGLSLESKAAKTLIPKEFKELSIDALDNAAFASFPKSKITGVRVMAILPDEEVPFEKVFLKPFSMATKAEMKAAAGQFSKLPKAQIFKDESFGAASLVNMIAKSTDDELNIVVGHSDIFAGKQCLFFPNGDKVPLAELYKIANAGGKSFHAVTCKSTKLGIKSDIDLDQAFNAISAALNLLERNGSSTYAEIEGVIKKQLIAEGCEATVQRAATESGGHAVTKIKVLEMKPDGGMAVRILSPHTPTFIRDIDLLGVDE